MIRLLARTICRRPASRGQALVEFAFVFPLFILLLVAMIEYGFLMNATLAASYATRDASLIGAEAGTAAGADCAILKKIEDDINGPSDPANITTVKIYQANPVTGAINGSYVDTYTRTTSPTLACTVGGVSFNLDYGSSPTLGYPYNDRCNVLNGAGCLLGQTGLDTIGVEITYNYQWHTPLKSLLGFSGPGWTIVKANAMEMEPVL